MARKLREDRTRWRKSSRPKPPVMTQERTTHERDVRSTRPTALPRTLAGSSPYELRYDVCDGYCTERSISVR